MILAAWALFFSLAPLRAFFWLHPVDLGVTTDSTLTVTDVDPDGPAYRAGVRVGQRVVGATPLAAVPVNARLSLQGRLRLARGHSLAVRVVDGNGSRAVTIRPKVQDSGTPSDPFYFGGILVGLIFVVVGSILVLLDPSKMTWAFFIFCIATGPRFHSDYYWLPTWLDVGSSAFADALRAVGFGAFLIFCTRAPSDRVSGRWRYLERSAPLVTTALLLCNAVIYLSILGYLHGEGTAERIQVWIVDATYVAGILALVATFFRERGVERSRAGWIAAGFIVGPGPWEGPTFFSLLGPLFLADLTSWQQGVPEILRLAVPLTVAYAVVRHHALNVGFVAKRTLVYGLLLCVGFATLALLTALATKTFARNGFEIGLDMAAALMVGMAIQLFHPRAFRFVDRIFLPERYRAAMALDTLRTSLRASRHDDDLQDREIESVAEELMLSSLAVFESLSDGGFVRSASTGWPDGATWHVFAGDSLVRSLNRNERVVTIRETSVAEIDVPSGLARPCLGISLSSPTAGKRLLLVGAHTDGRQPDHDEVRGVALLLGEPALRSIS